MKLNHKLSLAFLALLISGNNALASGYSTNLYSTSGLANSYAGSVTGSHDVSDMFWNPAVISDIKKAQFVASITHLDLNVDADNVRGNLGSAYGGGAISGNEIKNAGVDAQVPALYLATPLNNDISFGLAITAPFGLATKYDPSWVGRYSAIESSIITTNINPAISYKVNDQLSVGAGLEAQYIQMTLTKAVFTSGPDALGKTKGSDWGYGYTLGANYKLSDDLKVGIGYRSKIDYKLTGRSEVKPLNLYSDFDAKAITPESLTVGASYKASKDIELLSDVTWTRWSRFEDLIVNNNENATLNADNRTEFNWRDAYLFAVGANFKTDEKCLIRTGLAYEKDAVTDANRDARIPTGDRVWLSVGLNHKFTDDLSIDATYLHQFYRTVSANVTPTSTTTPRLEAHFKTRVDVFGIAIKKEF